jgi:hypothetical protein
LSEIKIPLKEEIINTDIIDNEDDDFKMKKEVNFNRNDFLKNSSQKTRDNNSNNLPNVENIKKINISNEFNCLNLYKWIYHLYLITGIILFIHYIIIMILNSGEYYFYKLISLILIIIMTFTGYLGIQALSQNINEKYFCLAGYNQFFTNFFIFVITILCFICYLSIGRYFGFIESQKIFGYLTVILYLALIIIEAIYLIYFDIIYQNQKNNEGLRQSSLNFQLVELNNGI